MDDEINKVNICIVPCEDNTHMLLMKILIDMTEMYCDGCCHTSSVASVVFYVSEREKGVYYLANDSDIVIPPSCVQPHNVTRKKIMDKIKKNNYAGVFIAIPGTEEFDTDKVDKSTIIMTSVQLNIGNTHALMLSRERITSDNIKNYLNAPFRIIDTIFHLISLEGDIPELENFPFKDLVEIEEGN